VGSITFLLKSTIIDLLYLGVNREAWKVFDIWKKAKGQNHDHHPPTLSLSYALFVVLSGRRLAGIHSLKKLMMGRKVITLPSAMSICLDTLRSLNERTRRCRICGKSKGEESPLPFPVGHMFLFFFLRCGHMFLVNSQKRNKLQSGDK
jgi:hypothetical protein